MRICVLKATKQILEMQSRAVEGTLIQNAIKAGYTAEQIEERVVDDASYAAAKLEDPIYISEKQAEAIKVSAEAAKIKEIKDNLITWSDMSDSIKAAATLDELKVIVNKIASITYLLAKNKSE